MIFVTINDAGTALEVTVPNTDLKAEVTTEAQLMAWVGKNCLFNEDNTVSLTHSSSLNWPLDYGVKDIELIKLMDQITGNRLADYIYWDETRECLVEREELI